MDAKTLNSRLLVGALGCDGPDASRPVKEGIRKTCAEDREGL